MPRGPSQGRHGGLSDGGLDVLFQAVTSFHLLKICLRTGLWGEGTFENHGLILHGLKWGKGFPVVNFCSH